MSSECHSINLPLDLNEPLYYVGPSIDKGPKPSVFYFCTSARQSLTKSPFCEFIKHLDPNIRVFSLSLPFHNEDSNNRHILRDFWSEEFQKRPSFLEDFFDNFTQVFNYLDHQNLFIENKIAVGGVSRGGFIACHLAARFEKIKFLLGFAPMTDLEGCPYFENLPESAYLYNASSIIKSLFNVNVLFLIGNRDIAVSSKNAASFILKLADYQFSNGVRSPDVQIKIRPSIGHRGHGTSSETFQEGAIWLQSHLIN